MFRIKRISKFHMRNEFGPEANILKRNVANTLLGAEFCQIKCLLSTPYCPLLLPTAHYLLSTALAHCPQSTVHSPLSTPTVYCPLLTVHCPLSISLCCPLPLSTVHHVSPLHLWFYLLLARRLRVKNNSDLHSTETDSVSAADWQSTVNSLQLAGDSSCSNIGQWTVGSRLWGSGHWIVGTGW